MKLVYCPEWYCRKINNKWKKILKIVFCIFLISVLTMFIDLNIYYNKITIAEDKLKKLNDNAIVQQDVENGIKGNDGVRQYVLFKNYADERKFQVKSIIVEDGIISASIYIDSKEDYSRTVETLEEKYKVISSTPADESEEKMYFDIKVKNND